MKTILWLCIGILVPLFGEMKCEAGKCGTAAKPVRTVPSNPLATTAASHPEATAPSSTRPFRAAKPTVKQLFGVRTVKVTQRLLSPVTSDYGYIVAADDRRSDIAPRFSGYIETLYANRRFMHVDKGEVLAKVYSPEVYRAKQDYLNALRFNDRKEAAAMVRGSRDKLALLGVDEAEIEALLRTRKASALTAITAPRSGWIFPPVPRQGAAFKAGRTLFRIVDLSEVWMEAKLYPGQLAEAATWKRFEIAVNGITERFPARRDILYPDSDPKEATYTLRLKVDNAEGKLFPGMFARMYASPDARMMNVLPAEAVIKKADGWYAFLATEFRGEYLPVKVDVRPVDAHTVEIRSGLRPGDEVVANALFMMDADAQINGIY